MGCRLCCWRVIARLRSSGENSSRSFARAVRDDRQQGLDRPLEEEDHEAQGVSIVRAWQDRDRVEEVLKKLQEPQVAKLDLPQDIADPIPLLEPGQDLRAEIRKQMQSASVVVVLWTQQAAVSDWVQYEVGMADALEKPIVVGAEKSAPQLPAPIVDSKVVTLDGESCLTSYAMGN